MSKPIITIHDIASDEYTSREMTNAEFAEYEKARKEKEAEADKAAAKAALFDRLGITAEEAALLLG